MKQKIALFWHRRDLRIEDNAGLYHALKSPYPVLPIFIFDTHILNKLEDKKDARVQFIHQEIEALQKAYTLSGGTLKVFYNTPEIAFEKLLNAYEVAAVYTNHDYEAYAIERDTKIRQLLTYKGVDFYSFKDQCIFEKDEVVKDDGKPYTVFTPYSRKWKAKLNAFYLKAYPSEKYLQKLYKENNIPSPYLAAMGFEKQDLSFPEKTIQTNILNNYHEQRDIPAVRGTSKLSLHLRFGTVSIRKLAQAGLQHNEKWLNELIWRDFYMMILYHFPHVQHSAFKKEYNHIAWRNNEDEFKRWCKGKTGYPIVDAGMRELNTTGFMHNRVRMIVASFLCKHLLIDWRWGEAYFAQKLLDFELSSNNGGWQWAAGSGCDAAPYFRVFNPELQTQKFDPKAHYIRKWLPEFDNLNYQQSKIVDHAFARNRALEVYKESLGKVK